VLDRKFAGRLARPASSGGDGKYGNMPCSPGWIGIGVCFVEAATVRWVRPGFKAQKAAPGPAASVIILSHRTPGWKS